MCLVFIGQSNSVLDLKTWFVVNVIVWVLVFIFLKENANFLLTITLQAGAFKGLHHGTSQIFCLYCSEISD